VTPPLLTVITATFQHGHFLRESMASVLRQTEPNIELIVIDDGSTDGSYYVARELAERDARVVLVRHMENRGLAAAQNTGIARASSPWVLKVDADDYISDSYVEQILKAAELPSRPNVIFSPAHLFGDKDYVYRYPAFDAARMRDELMIPGPAAFRKELWAAVGGYDETMRSAEDWDLYIRAECVVGLVPFQLAQPLWHYRQHAGVRASAHGMERIRYLRAYWQGHTRETVLARSRSWGQWCAERKVAA
jgi:glycosyltransferase involved in cell wall biosynthesis